MYVHRIENIEKCFPFAQPFHIWVPFARLVYIGRSLTLQMKKKKKRTNPFPSFDCRHKAHIFTYVHWPSVSHILSFCARLSLLCVRRKIIFFFPERNNKNGTIFIHGWKIGLKLCYPFAINKRNYYDCFFGQLINQKLV